jgi:hypothetical protein
MYVFVCIYELQEVSQLIYYTTHHFSKGIQMLHSFPNDKLLFFYTLIGGDLKLTHTNLMIHSSESNKEGEQ